MSKLYQYTILKQDGTKAVLPPRKKMSLDELQAHVGGNIELVHKDYYSPDMNRRSTIYIDEEGRFKEGNHENPHFMSFGDPWNIVGNALVEEVYHGE